MRNRGFYWLMLGVTICAVAVSGCKKKKPTGPGVGGVGGVVTDPSGLGTVGDDLSSRPSDFATIASQFGVVYFDYDSAQVNPAERTKVEAVAEYLRSNTSVGLIVEGNCDERGSNEYNLALGERRALAVRAYLVGLGIDGSRVQTKSNGEERPLAMGHDDASWSQNRRAEFVLFQ